MPSPLVREPKLSVEYDCRMRSNNLGLLQDDDVLREEPRDHRLRRQFYGRPGRCPWFYKLQARRTKDRLLNAGLQGTGFAQWWRMFEYSKTQDVVAKRVLLVAISNDFKRKGSAWPEKDFNCLDRGECAWEGVCSLQPVRPTRRKRIAGAHPRALRHAVFQLQRGELLVPVAWSSIPAS